MATSREWCVTVHNVLPVDGELFVPEHVNLRYAVWQCERAPSTGALHHQIFLIFVRPVRMAYVKNLLQRPDAHCEKMRGTREQADAYCRKEETRFAGPWSHGRMETEQGKRRDLEALFECAKSGLSLAEAAAQVGAWAFTYARAYDRAIDEYKAANWAALDDEDEVLWQPPTVLVFYGESGSGKSRMAAKVAKANFKANNWGIYRKMPGEWWEGYRQEEVILMDDFYGSVRWGTLLQLLDGYHGIRVEKKGGSVPWNAKLIIITSNKHPRDWYPSIADPTPLARRISELTYWQRGQPEVIELWDGESAADAFLEAQREADARAAAALCAARERPAVQEGWHESPEF